MDEVHAWLRYRREVTRATVRALAKEIGISRSTVDTFHRHRVHPERIWPKLRDWYMSNRRAHAASTAYRPHPIIQLIGALELVDGLPAPQRIKGMRTLAALMRTLYREGGLPESHLVKLLETVDESETPDSIRQKIGYRVPPPDRIDL